MGLLDSNSKKMLVESMRHALIKSVKGNATLTESVQMESVKFVKESATYEQLLNMTLNPVRESKYLPSHVLEGAVAVVSEAMLTGRRVIGINALTEGALNLVEKTDCVVTEAMLDAADQIAQSKSIYVVAEAIQRMNVVTEAKKKDAAKKASDSAKSYAKKSGEFLGKITGVTDLKNAAKEVGKAKEAKSVVKTVDANLKGKSKQGLKNLGKATVKMMKKNKKEASDTAKKATDAAKKLGTKGGAKLAATAAAATAAALGAKKAIKNWHDKKSSK